ncbi:MAG TPA: CPBP family glutamic-type intramembrane protease [Nitrososphaerales archaeon]|nr:CPBP family glutamic-type intramembrane protease [Nitrososphaerales archaeon]
MAAPYGEDVEEPTTWGLILFVAVALFTVAMMLVSFPAGLYTVFATSISTTIGASTLVRSLVYNFVFADVRLPIGGDLGELFILFSAIYLVFFLLAAKQGSGLFRSLKLSMADGYRALFSNPLSATLVMLGATSMVTVVLDALQTSSGVATGSIGGDPFSLLLDFTLAPLLEETTFRLLLLGVPVLAVALFIFKGSSPQKALRMLWRPSSAWDTDETDASPSTRSFKDPDPALFPSGTSGSLKARAMKPVVYTFLAFSSLAFGYAHYASGSGWGPGKVSEATLAGLALGYLYIKYGFHTNVLLHWSINYVGSVYSFLALGLWGIPWTSNTGSLLDVVPSIDFILLLGLPSTMMVANELLRRFLKPKAERPAGPPRL